RAGSSKAGAITKKDRNSKQTQQTQLSNSSKYADMSLPDLREMVKPLGIPGSGGMRTDELLQLCALFESELTEASQNSRTTTQPASRSLGLRRKSCTAEPCGSNDNSARSTRKQPVSKSNNHRTAATLTEDHVSEIDINTDLLFKTPESQLLQTSTRDAQGKMEEGDEGSSDDGGVQDPPVAYPSREKGTALPRPRPTILSAVEKGKQRRISMSSDDWVPDASHHGTSSSSGSTMELDRLDKSELAGVMDLGSDDDLEDQSIDNSGSSGEGEEQRFNFNNNLDDSSRAAISRLSTAPHTGSHVQSGPSNSRIPSENVNPDDDLRQTVRDLTSLVMQLVSDPTSTKQRVLKVKKPQGSTFRARIRSHVWTMMGLQSDDDVPPSATLGQQSMWKIHTSRKDMMKPFRLDPDVANGFTSSANDPRFPFKGGPGGEYSNPQILLIMWTMMNRVGVSSFRPIWEQSMTAPANKFLWTLATATFLHLVKSGEYDDITAEDANFDAIFSALKEHARSSLKRSFRESNEWSQAKMKAHKKHGVRVGRLRTVSRTTVQFSQPLYIIYLHRVTDSCPGLTL
ncbi:hypothetical protein DFH28DRAFT_889805, partial [Melampsora americana]